MNALYVLALSLFLLGLALLWIWLPMAKFRHQRLEELWNELREANDMLLQRGCAFTLR